jgi:60S ribosome subunit biogenesis protein NIP7
MRPLTEEESKTLFAKLANYIGSNLVHLVDTPDDVSLAFSTPKSAPR